MLRKPVPNEQPHLWPIIFFVRFLDLWHIRRHPDHCSEIQRVHFCYSSWVNFLSIAWESWTLTKSCGHFLSSTIFSKGYQRHTLFGADQRLWSVTFIDVRDCCAQSLSTQCTQLTLWCRQRSHCAFFRQTLRTFWQQKFMFYVHGVYFNMWHK